MAKNIFSEYSPRNRFNSETLADLEIKKLSSSALFTRETLDRPLVGKDLTLFEGYENEINEANNPANEVGEVEKFITEEPHIELGGETTEEEDENSEEEDTPPAGYVPIEVPNFFVEENLGGQDGKILVASIRPIEGKILLIHSS